MDFAAQGGMIDGRARGNGRFLVGVGVSVAVHVLVMFAYRHSGTVMPAFEPEPTSLVVSIRPLPPPPPPRVEEPPPAPVPRAAPAAAPRSTRSAPKRVIAVPEPAQPSPDPFVVQQAAEPAAPAADETPTFDMGAAKQAARTLAGQTKLGREGTALAQFPDPPLETETKAARAISKAKRRNCKDGIPGGLLAPLFLALDKKDSGCKW